jgi:hypothetical protein
MNSVSDVQSLLRTLEGLVPLFDIEFDPKDPDLESLVPLTGSQRRQINAWKTMLAVPFASGISKTRKYIRQSASRFALQVKKTAGRETSFLCILVYSISGLPKINYPKFYNMLREWSHETTFPKLLEKVASEFWGSSSQGTPRGEDRTPEYPDTGSVPSEDITVDSCTA